MLMRCFHAWLLAACLVAGCATPASAQRFPVARFMHLATFAAPSGGPPLLSAAAGWNGTACSGFGATLSAGVCTGGSAPVDPTRTTAKPALQGWWQNNQRLASNLVIGVDAVASGTAGGTDFGVASVKFYAENGTAVTVTTPTVLADTDANGNARKRLGYWVNLNVLGAVAQHGSNNDMAVYAEAIPRDATMQHRVIGPIIVHPEATANDISYTVNAANNDVSPNFTTIKNALNAARLAGANAPLIKFTATANYEMEDGTWTAVTTAKGYPAFVADVGVTATIRRAAFPTGDETTWAWDPRWYGLEFRGSGIVIDFRNISGIVSTGRDSWFNGVKVTNSIGTRDTNYWNKGLRPGGLGCQTDYCYVDDSILEYFQSPAKFLRRVSNTAIRGAVEDLFSGTAFFTGNYVADMDQRFFAVAINSLQITYTGASATATVEKTGSSDDQSNGWMVLSENGSAVATLNMGHLSTETYFDEQNVADYINNVLTLTHPGWSATVLNNTRRAASLQPISPTSAKSVTVTLQTRIDVHSDVYQSSIGGGGTRENVIGRGNIVRGVDQQLQTGGIVAGANETFLLDAVNNYDIALIDNFVESGQGTYTSGYYHVMIWHNTLGGLGQLNGRVADVYSLQANNLIMDGLYNVGGGYPTQGQFNNNGYLLVPFPGDPSGSNYVGNFHFPESDATTLRTNNLVNAAAGDARPKPSSTLATTLKPANDNYDVRLNPRAANDAVGAFAITAPAPTYPF